MFQTFTGTARRPRQVNLSGRNKNPFAATAKSIQTTIPYNAQHAVLHAQQERVTRQQERDRLQAVKTLQRLWRGYTSRREFKEYCRKEWDTRENRLQTGAIDNRISQETSDTYVFNEETLSQLRLLVQFASPYHREDVGRIRRFATRFRFEVPLDSSLMTTDSRWIYPLLRIANTNAAILRRGATVSPLPTDTMNDLLRFLSVLTTLMPGQLMHRSHIYYNTLAQIIAASPPHVKSFGPSHELVENVMLSLLRSSPLDVDNVYESFASELLTSSNLQSFLGSLDGVAQALNQKLLETTLDQLLTIEYTRAIAKRKSYEEILWLLSYFIHITRLHQMNEIPSKVPDFHYIRIISDFLAYLSDDISSRIDTAADSSASPLPTFIRDEVLTLVDQRSITALLTDTDLVNEMEKGGWTLSDKVGTLANFGLTLLRVFPRKREDILLWLYLGSTSNQSSSDGQNCSRIPAIKFFWKTIARTGVYSLVHQEPSNAVDLLRYMEKSERDSPNKLYKQEWKVILLFLELYTFVLKVTDDEEFVSGGSVVNGRQSWTSQSALELKQVQDLTVFLKNLAFAMYWDGPQILGLGESLNPTSLTDYFSTSNVLSYKNYRNDSLSKIDDINIEGLSSTTLTYMKDMVTGLLRMIYERE